MHASVLGYLTGLWVIVWLIESRVRGTLLAFRAAVSYAGRRGWKERGLETAPCGLPDRDRGTITRILVRHRKGSDTALADAVTAVYSDLQRIAGRQLANERRSPTFDTESLVHEVYLKLVGQDRTAWQNRGHFFAIAARIMRRILVDRARRRDSAKRGGREARTTTLTGKNLPDTAPGLDVLTLDDALLDLKNHDECLAQLVELRFFGGLSNPEIADIQGVTSMTVIRRWRLARAWLQRYLTRRGAPEAEASRSEASCGAENPERPTHEATRRAPGGVR